MRTNADVCGRMQTYADVCGRMRTYAGAQQAVVHVGHLRVCRRMPTYADVCGRMQVRSKRQYMRDTCGWGAEGVADELLLRLERVADKEHQVGPCAAHADVCGRMLMYADVC